MPREVGGASPVSPAAGAALRFIAAALGAKAVVEIGTGCGTSGIWLLRGMRRDAVLTSVDVEPEHQRLARRAFTEAGFASNRFRLITRQGLDVLPRLTDGGYDLVFCDADKQEYPAYLTAALRLLRPGGVVAFDNALWGGRVADPGQDDPETAAIRELARAGPRRTSAWCRCCCRSATACWRRSSAASGCREPGEQQPGAEPGRALGVLPLVGRRTGPHRRCPGAPRAGRR